MRKDSGPSKTNRDFSIVYKLHGKNPYRIDLYGIFTHEDLGTGTPPKRGRQQDRADQFNHQQFVDPTPPPTQGKKK